MSKSINIVKKNIVKNSILNGKSGRESMLLAGYSKSAANQLKNMGVYNCIMKEIEEEFKISNVTIDSVLKSIEAIKQMSIEHKDYSTALRADELKGKYLAMFTDKQEFTNIDKQDNQFSLERLSRLKQSPSES